LSRLYDQACAEIICSDACAALASELTLFEALRDAEGSKFQLHDTKVSLPAVVLLHLTLRRFQSIKGGFMKQANGCE
jgi:hypothetical protein